MTKGYEVHTKHRDILLAIIECLECQNSALLKALEHGQGLATRLLTEQVGGRNLPSWMRAMIQGFGDEANTAIAAAKEEVK